MVARICEKLFSSRNIDRVIEDIWIDIIEHTCVVLAENFDGDLHHLRSIYEICSGNPLDKLKHNAV
jgi:hypothetical protein